MSKISEIVRVALIGNYRYSLMSDSHNIFKEFSVRSPGITKVYATSSIGDLKQHVKKYDLDVLVITNEINENIFSTIKHARSNYNSAGILIINEFFDCELLACGGDGLIVGSHSIEIAIKGIRAVSKRNLFLADCLCDYFVEATVENISRSPRKIEIEGLNARDIQIIELSAKGFNNMEIADRLNVSSKTIEGRRTDIYRTVNCNDNRELTIFALKNNIVMLDNL